MVEEKAPSGRGIALTLWLSGYSVAVVVVEVLLAVHAVGELDRGRMLPVAVVLGMVALLGEAAALTGLWFWRRWGVGLLAGCVVVQVVAGLMAEVNGGIIAARIVLACALVFMLIPRWERLRG
ncbi:hypothetical protein [Amycolatopsis sp. 195334CR]|uniref:hypothetical protein n=1 Tax=Amycolatopsis sp. 195334CR TaxID=2814588 RepID=UPI001A8EF72B|nr:hypothetical protein [Amycolatopsis sp. 195334CR]MBN6040199.1 hypothetical protein [Amycolatopsis sp. 195334CR]